MVLDEDLSQIQNKFSDSTPNIILFSHPFVKAEFLNRIIETSDRKIIYLDFDLLYSGYVTAKLVKQNPKVRIYRLNFENYHNSLAEIIDIISRERFLIIIDSLNGLNNLFEEKDFARFVNSSIMLLSTAASSVKSHVIVCAMGRRKDSEWVLVPGGRHILEPIHGTTFYVKEATGKLRMTEFENKLN